MPELPDIMTYVEALERNVGGHVLESARLLRPFVLRSVDPPLSAVERNRLLGVSRIGKRLVLALENGLFIVIHLMIAGRLRWLPGGKKPPGRLGLLALDFDNGTLVLTEAGTKRRASVYVVGGGGGGREALREFDRGGLDVLSATAAQFAERLRRENHTLKRSL